MRDMALICKNYQCKSKYGSKYTKNEHDKKSKALTESASKYDQIN